MSESFFLGKILTLPIFSPLKEQDISHRHEDKIENQQLSSLPVGGADVPLKNGIRDGEHCGKYDNW